MPLCEQKHWFEQIMLCVWFGTGLGMLLGQFFSYNLAISIGVIWCILEGVFFSGSNPHLHNLADWQLFLSHLSWARYGIESLTICEVWEMPSHLRSVIWPFTDKAYDRNPDSRTAWAIFWMGFVVRVFSLIKCMRVDNPLIPRAEVVKQIERIFDCIYNYFHPQEVEDLDLTTMSEDPDFTTAHLRDRLQTQNVIAPSLLKQRTNYDFHEQEDFEYTDPPDSTAGESLKLKAPPASVHVTPASPSSGLDVLPKVVMDGSALEMSNVDKNKRNPNISEESNPKTAQRAKTLKEVTEMMFSDNPTADKLNRGRTLTPANLDTSPSERERASMVRKMESLQAKMEDPVSNSYDVQWEHNVPALTSNEPTEDHTSTDTRKYV